MLYQNHILLSGLKSPFRFYPCHYHIAISEIFIFLISLTFRKHLSLARIRALLQTVLSMELCYHMMLTV